MQGLVLELASTAPMASADAETSPVTPSAGTVTLSAAKTDASHTDAANAGALSSVAPANAHPAGKKSIAVTHYCKQRQHKRSEFKAFCP